MGRNAPKGAQDRAAEDVQKNRDKIADTLPRYGRMAGPAITVAARIQKYGDQDKYGPHRLRDWLRSWPYRFWATFIRHDGMLERNRIKRGEHYPWMVLGRFLVHCGPDGRVLEGRSFREVAEITGLSRRILRLGSDELKRLGAVHGRGPGKEPGSGTPWLIDRRIVAWREDGDHEAVFAMGLPGVDETAMALV